VEMAAQAAIGFAARSRRLKHSVFVFGDRLQDRKELFFDVNVTGGALAVAAALGDNPVDAVLDGAFHYGVAERNVNSARNSGVGNIGDFGHVGRNSHYRPTCPQVALKMEIDFDVGGNGHRLAIKQRGLEAPLLNCLDCLLIQAHAQGADNLDVLRDAVFVDHDLQ
jgi:hypothetical protein